MNVRTFKKLSESIKYKTPEHLNNEDLEKK